MTETRKLAIVIAVLAAFAVVTFVFHRLRERVNVWLALLIVSLIILMMALSIHPIRAHDHARPVLNDWLKSLQSKNNLLCCDGTDTDAIEDWETKDSRYRVKFRGEWFDVPDGAIVEGPNKGGDALLWMNKGFSGMSVRCFMPGTLS
jgi:hypothetical protein